MDKKLEKNEIRKIFKDLKNQEQNPLLIPTYIISLESIAHEGYAVINPDVVVSGLDLKFDLLIDVSTQKKHPGYDSIPIIDYTNYAIESSGTRYLDLISALENFEKLRYDTFDRALFFSSNSGDVHCYRHVVDDELKALRLCIIGVETISKSNPDLSSMLCSEIGKIYEKYISQKLNVRLDVLSADNKTKSKLL